MGFRSSLARSALKYAAEKLDDMRRPRADVRSDLAPVMARLDRMDERLRGLPAPWMTYAILALSLLAMLFSLWALIRTF